MLGFKFRASYRLGKLSTTENVLCPDVLAIEVCFTRSLSHACVSYTCLSLNAFSILELLCNIPLGLYLEVGKLWHMITVLYLFIVRKFAKHSFSVSGTIVTNTTVFLTSRIPYNWSR